MNGLERVEIARIQLVQSAPFFGVLALHLEIVESTVFQTMATDGIKLYVNVAFGATLTDAQLRGVLCHEVMHCASGHMARQGGRDHDQWNEAADYEINQEILAMDYELPQGALMDSRFNGWTAENIFAYRARQVQNKPEEKPGKNGAGNGADGKPGNDPGNCGSFIQPDKPGLVEAIAREWQGKALMAAAIAGKQAGSLPGSIERLIASLRAPSVSWREVLRRIVSESISSDYSWSRPNRRHIANGLYLPSLVSDGRGRLIVFIDTSGSIDIKAFEAFKGELQQMLDERAADYLTIVFCDSRIQSVVEFESGDSLQGLACHGGGGTDFAPAMQWAIDNGQGAAAIIYFTDLECDSFGIDPGLPVIWANWARPCKVPFGDVIQIDGHA